jgi:hypothetical protein
MRKQIHEQQHRLAREEEEEGDCLAGARERAAPPRRISTRGNKEESRGTPRPHRQRIIPRRRFLNGSGEWRGGEELREVGGSGISRPWISADKKRAEVSLFPRKPARAPAVSRRWQDSPA